MAKEKQETLSWEFPEFTKYERTKKWWVWYGVVGGILFILSIIYGNLLAALIIIMVSIIVVHQQYHTPAHMRFKITRSGIEVDGRNHSWSELDHFWLAYEPPEVKMLFISFKSRVRPILNIPLTDQDPIQIRKMLREFMEEDLEKETEPTIDALGRLLKL